VIAVIVVALDEDRDLALQFSRQVIVFKQDAVLQRLMPALDFAFRFSSRRSTVRPSSFHLTQTSTALRAASAFRQIHYAATAAASNVAL
jgi:hypothetical protein